MPESEPTTRRAFHCQDALWDAFADLAIDRDSTIDILINEAMKAYLSSSQPMTAIPMAQPQVQPQMAQPQVQPQMAQPQVQPQMAQPVPQPQQMAQPVPQPQQLPPAQPNFNRAPAPVPMGRQSIPAPAQQRPVPSFNGRAASPLPPPATPSFLPQSSQPSAIQPFSAPQGQRVPPPTPAYKRPPSIFEEPAEAGVGNNPMALASLNNQQRPAQGLQSYPQPPAPPFGQIPLYIIFANQKYTIDKDKYIIGRSSQLADLVIRDGNISRKHCAVLYKNGQYYIKDLDSTNGIEFQGNRIDTKRIEEGDQFNICEFQFTFTYR